MLGLSRCPERIHPHSAHRIDCLGRLWALPATDRFIVFHASPPWHSAATLLLYHTGGECMSMVPKVVVAAQAAPGSGHQSSNGSAVNCLLLLKIKKSSCK